MESALQPGVVLAERYRLIHQLARGGMGSVWRAEHVTLSLEVAVKVIDPRIASLELGVPRFLREARALAGLRCPQIVQVSDFGSHGSLVFLVMELLRGRTLGQRLKAEGKLSAAETLRVLDDVCRAMSHAHERGVIHRDLKPENIFLCDASHDHVTKVIDFGIAKPTGLEATSNTDTGTGAFLGTPSYMSPEQCRAQVVDQRSDLWAIGVIAYECLLGRRLFSADVVGELVISICTGELPLGPELGQLPHGFEGWLRKALAREPEQRFQTASELFAELSAVLSGAAEASSIHAAETLSDAQPSVPPPVSSLGPSAATATLLTGSVRQSARRAGSRRWSLVAGAALVAAAVGVIVLRQQSARQPAPEAAPESIAAARPAAERPVTESPANESPDTASPAAATADAPAPQPATATADAGAEPPPASTPRPQPRAVPPRSRRPAERAEPPELEGLRRQR